MSAAARARISDVDAVRQHVVEPELLQRDAEREDDRPGGDQRAAVRGGSQQLEQIVAAGHAPRDPSRAEYPWPPMSELVLSEDHGPVRHVVLNRPEKRNAFHGELVLATGEALRAAADDPDVRCVVLRGAGPMFSSGMDLGTLAEPGGGARAAAHVPARSAWRRGTWRRRCPSR